MLCTADDSFFSSIPAAVRRHRRPGLRRARQPQVRGRAPARRDRLPRGKGKTRKLPQPPPALCALPPPRRRVRRIRMVLRCCSASRPRARGTARGTVLKSAGGLWVSASPYPQDPDESLKKKTLDLLYKMTKPFNVDVQRLPSPTVAATSPSTRFLQAFSHCRCSMTPSLRCALPRVENRSERGPRSVILFAALERLLIPSLLPSVRPLSARSSSRAFWTMSETPPTRSSRLRRRAAAHASPHRSASSVTSPLTRSPRPPHPSRTLTGTPGLPTQVARIAELSERYAPSNAWFIKTMDTLFELEGDLMKPQQAHSLMRLIAEGGGEEDEAAESELRASACASYVDLLRKPKLNALLLQVIFWVLGEYGVSAGGADPAQLIAEVVSAVETQPAAMASHEVQGYALSAVTKIVVHTGCPIGPAAESFAQRLARSRSTDLQQRSAELRARPSELIRRQRAHAVQPSCSAAARLRRCRAVPPSDRPVRAARSPVCLFSQALAGLDRGISVHALPPDASCEDIEAREPPSAQLPRTLPRRLAFELCSTRFAADPQLSLRHRPAPVRPSAGGPGAGFSGPVCAERAGQWGVAVPPAGRPDDARQPDVQGGASLRRTEFPENIFTAHCPCPCPRSLRGAGAKHQALHALRQKPRGVPSQLRHCDLALTPPRLPDTAASPPPTGAGCRCGGCRDGRRRRRSLLGL